jgi:uncharacterized protein YndB with AHSA1/START domain
MTDPAQFVLDRTAHSITLRRRVNASPERVFDSWTRVDLISRWWDPTGRPLAGCEIDLRVGGRFRLINEGFEAHPFEGFYTDISPPNRIAFEAMGAAGTVTLDRDGDATLMTVSMTCGSAEQLEQFVAMGIGEGTARSLDNLVAMMATT